MSKNTSSSSSGGVGFTGALTLLFVALKLLGYIDWSWWWVFMPVLAGTAFWLLLLAFLVWLHMR